MKISKLTKDELIVTVTPDGFERAYLVDHVGRERVSVTVVGGREQGKDWTACAAIEQQVSLDTGAFFVLAGPAIGGLVRSQAWALADARVRSDESTLGSLPAKAVELPVLPCASLPDGYRLEDWRPKGPGWPFFAVVDKNGDEFTLGYTPEAAVKGALSRIEREASGAWTRPLMQVDYDADSNLPLGWSWGEAEWPGCDRILPTAMGPNGERIAKHGDIVYTGGFAFTNSYADLATRSAVLRACDALAAARSAKPRWRQTSDDLGEPVVVRKWADRFSTTSDVQALLIEQTISALAKEATKGYELMGWTFGRDGQGCWYAAGWDTRIVRSTDGGFRREGSDYWDWAESINPILNRLATDPALNTT